MKQTLLVLFILALTVSAKGQESSELFMPFEFQQAYMKGIRDKSGRPGENYWQNSSFYNIDVKVDPEAKIITGSAKITYYNNSPDTLRVMVIRTYHDLYQEGKAKDRYINPEDLTEGVKLSNVKIDDIKIDLDNRFAAYRSGTNVFMRLPEHLMSDDSLTLSLDWQTQIPEETLIRMGAINESTMFVAYWYPQISVYDDIDGWDYFDYRSRQEFYQNLAEFDVTINLPAGYLVWATGDLTNASTIYKDEIIENLERASASDETIRITDKPGKSLQTKKGLVTWNFKAQHVSDFAFALSDHYVWDASSVVLDSSTMDRVIVHTVFNEGSEKRFKHVTEFQRQSLLYFCHEFPGVLYPYNQFTTFQGLKSGGMEFPMMANNGDYAQRNDTLDRLLTLEVTAHEIAHSYMPFYVLVNERKYTWMEEGWATLLGERATSHIKQFSGISEQYSMEKLYQNRFYGTEGTQFSVPLMTPSIVIKNRTSHFHVSYYKAYYAYRALENALGKEKFMKALHAYFERWHWKHPTPYDFFYTFNDVSGENLNWFWEPWFFNFAYPDLAISGNDENQVTIKNAGGLPIPFQLRVIYADNSLRTYPYAASIWKNADHEVTVKVDAEKEVKSIELISWIVPDVNLTNNKTE